MIQPIQIGSRFVGPGYPCFIIAEAGVNHNGDMQLARQLIDAAVVAKVDAIKFQSFITEELITSHAPKAGYQVVTTGEAGGQFAMLKALELTPAQYAELKAYCEQAGLIYLCTPYENRSVDMLAELDITAYKIASTDTTNLPFLRFVASKQRPVLLSTGMSDLGEVEAAVTALWEGGLRHKMALLHCTSEYPSPVQEINLRAMRTLEHAFSCPVGYSDHTQGLAASAWAVAAGACILEKHFTLDRSLPGPDHRASLEPGELSNLVEMIRDVEAALGDGVKRPTASELANKPMMQKSLVARQDIAAGQAIEAAHLTCKRPATGLPPAWFDKVIGKKAAAFIPADTILDLTSVDWDS
ncbi:MAG: N-acetylneuraminate synthase [Caldilineales bacterium]|nr:N-acetylneuraminate synthase [Caldilineales bacterium]